MSQLSRPLRLLLLLSLALNLALGSTLLVQHLRSDTPGTASEERRWSRMPSPRHLARVLDEGDRQILLALAEQHRQPLSRSYRPLGQARRSLAQALRAEPFDPDALQAAFEQTREHQAATGAAMNAFMLDLTRQISPEGRHKIAEQLERRSGRRSREGGTREREPTASEPGGP